MDTNLVADIKIIEPRVTDNYSLPVKVYFGRGVAQKLPELLVGRYQRILLVAGQHTQKDPVWQLLVDKLSTNALVLVYEGVIKQSTPEQINPLLQVVRAGNFDVVVGVGGGTILDSVKSVAYLARTEGNIEDYLGGKSADQPGIPWVALPTTAGTGSEVTPWATIWGSDNKKYSLYHPEMFAELALVDPGLTDTLPVKETATTGADALTQAVESFWSVNHNPISDGYALEAIKILMNNLPGVVSQPVPVMRDQVMWGSLLSGLAFSNTQTTICHAISYPLTSRWHISHGQAVAVSLPLAIEKILPVVDFERQQALLLAMGASDIKSVAEKMRLLFQQIGLATTLTELGVAKTDFPGLVTDILSASRLANSPVIPDAHELLIWLNALAPVDELTDKDRAWSNDLAQLKEILDTAGVKYWLDMGTLLGAIREGKFIGWDDDIDLSAPIADVPKVLSLVDQFYALGYRVDVTDSSIYLSGVGKPKIGLAFYRERGDQVWISFLIKYPKFDGLLRHMRRVANKITYQPWQRGLPRLEQIFYSWCPSLLRQIIRQSCFWLETVCGERNYALVVPKRLVDNLSTIKFYNLEFKVPHPAEEYLAWMYGDDWRVPNPKWRWEDTKAINYQFVPFVRRADYNLFNPQVSCEIENKIVHQFEQVGDDWVEGEAGDDNFEWQIIRNFLGQPIGSNQQVLDVGSGKGKFTAKIKTAGFAVVGVEPASNLISAARTLHPDIDFVSASATHLPFPDNTFSHLVCVEVLEHLPDTDQAIREFYRVLQPGGRLLIVDKNSISWHYLYFLPTALWKWIKESTNQWMYAKDFPFREKYFVPESLQMLLQRYFREVNWQGVQFKPLSRKRSGFNKWYWRVNQAIAGWLHRYVPDRDFYLAWQAIK